MSSNDEPLESFAEVPELSPGPICRIALNGRVELANKAARALFGPEDPVGQSWADICPPTPPSLWKRVLGGGGPVSFDALLGKREFTMTLVSRSPHVYVFGTDVTELLESERTLTRHIAELAAMGRFPEMSPGLSCRLDRDAKVVLANNAARRLFHIEDLIGRSWMELCPQMTKSLWAQILAAREDVSFETRIDDRDMLLTHTPGANSWDIFVFGTDLTSQKAAEAALRQSEKMATLGTLSAGVAHELNNPASAASRAAGQLADAIRTMQSAQLRLARVQMSDREIAEMEQLAELARARAGSTADLSAVVCADREAAVEAWLEAHDIDDGWDLAPDLVQLGLDPEALDRLRDCFAAAHLATALRWVCHARRVEGLRDEVTTGSARVAEIVAALKAYTYLGQAPEQYVDVNEGIKNTLIILGSRLEGITIERDLAEGLPKILATGSELNEVWTHLIDNAIWAMQGSGTLELRSTREDGHVLVEVADTGRGIPADIQARIFDPFFTTRGPGEGTGLGLNTVQGIVVKKHAGHVDVESRPGRTVFRVRLPVPA